MAEEMKNINEATREEVAKLPFIGEQRAEMVIHHREVHGDFKTVDDIAKVTGMNERLAQRIGEYFQVGTVEKEEVTEGGDEDESSDSEEKGSTRSSRSRK